MTRLACISGSAGMLLSPAVNFRTTRMTRMKAPIPDNEAQRLAALREYHILDTAAEQAYDDITALAAYLCEVPIAMISLVDESRQWFKSKLGLNQQETPRDVAFCAHAILQTEPLIVRDALKDARFADSALVTRSPHIRFYAGFPAGQPGGLCLGHALRH